MKLKQILKQHAINHSDLARATGLSKTTLSHLINFDKWPKKQSPNDIKNAIEAYLKPLNIVLQDDAFQQNSEDNQDMQKEMISQAARKVFGIFKDPFTDDINTYQDVFLSPDIKYIRETVFQAAKHGGFVAVIGESGAGKSVLRRDLIDRIQREDHQITIITPVMPDKLKLTAASLEDSIIYDLDPNAKPKRAQEAKARQMHKLLTDSAKAGNSHCLVIEEAHDLSLPTLKQLKRFWELEDGFKRLLSIVLIGQPELKNKLNERINWEAREVIRRCEIAELSPLGDRLGDYLKHKFSRINVDINTIFTSSAIDAIGLRLTQSTRDKRLISMTYPLIVNNLVIKILNQAAEIGANLIDADIVNATQGHK